ncbi:MAG: hypothetical protein ACD_71C00215G0007 [uncultured bacterium (gcode 4)]|uniref:Uncharacterized protein n=1 Tax=uncultured bacterium (gcode 4) TaxID=1234023 RepID=K1YMM6_9BACT|nr:MAG: hypothetical protein ACD_71C00215G0007 [uncultured bacterium (gcode 4)]
MTSINIKTFVENNTKDVSIYTALTEAIVNWIHGIEELREGKNGEIVVEFQRSEQTNLDSLPLIKSVTVSDNGAWFNTSNYDYFDEIHTSHKIDIWGKWFWRLTFLKFFETIQIDSYYKEEEKFHHRTFDFVDDKTIIANPLLIENLPERDNLTSFKFRIKEKHHDKLDKGLDTIARKIFEKMFPFFVDENYHCPKIVLKDGTSEIVLNDYLENYKWIEKIENTIFTLSRQISADETISEEFNVKIYKVFHSQSHHSINLVADKRVVVDEKLSRFIPEFNEALIQKYENEKGQITEKGFIVQAYVVSKYLNERVTHDREWFDFEKTKQQIWAFSSDDIYHETAKIIKNLFKDEYTTRKDKKIKRINEYVKSNAKWHLPYIHDINFDDFWYDLKDEEIEIELQKIKIKREVDANSELNSIIKNKSTTSWDKSADVIKLITENSKSDLIHYVVNRKLVLEYFKELLRRDDDWKAELEEDIHNVIYPMWKDSTDTDYEDHNLWLLDERLVFSHYIASDKKISRKWSKLQQKSSKEPDLLMFDYRQSFRWWENESSNPLTIFEFKRPKRPNYTAEDNPIIQIAKYLEDIKDWKHEMPEWLEKIKVTNETPVYWYVIADITEKIVDFAKQQGLVKSPDGEWYFGFLSSYWLYVEIISYKKLLKDAELRNKVFFERLWL